MYEKYTRQALPDREYRELLGTALCVFNSNNAFIIENILRIDNENYNWYDMIDKESGKLKPIVNNTITKITNNKKIYTMFSSIVDTRNRIIHSYQITDENDNQLLATKDRTGQQYNITKKLLLKFIKDNENLSVELHKFRGY